MINGKDPVSLQVLELLLTTEAAIKDLPAHYPITLDQAKRLSRYANMLKAAEGQLTAHAFAKLRALGLKALYLSPLFRQEDWNALNEVLPALDDDMRRDDIPKYIAAMLEKQKQIQSMNEQTKVRLHNLRLDEQSVRESLERLELLQKKVRESLGMFGVYSKETQDFIMKHVGTYPIHNRSQKQSGDAYVLIRRLHPRFQDKLKKEGILVYHEFDYVHQITDIFRFIEAYHTRKANKRAGLLWNGEEEHANYKVGQSLVSPQFRKEMEQKREQLADIERRQKENEEELRTLQNRKLDSFIEAASQPDGADDGELKLHQDLQVQAAKWLYSQGYAAVFEFYLPNGKRVDVMGMSPSGELICIEVKASRADFLRDHKWREYLPFCHKLYFLGSTGIFHSEDYKEKKAAGFIIWNGNRMNVKQEPANVNEAKEVQDTLFAMLRAASKRMIFGY